MADLFIQCPEMPDQRIALPEGGVVVGRGEDADVFIAEKKASRRHLRIRPAPGGGYVAEELGSSNGTWLGEQRILRRLMEPGDVLRIGDTTLRIEPTGASPATTSEAAAPPPVIGGTLAITAVRDTAADAIPAAPEPPPAPPASSVGSGSVDAGPARGSGGSRRAPGRGGGSSKAILFIGIAIAILVGEHLLLGGEADQAAKETASLAAYQKVLGSLDAPLPEFLAEVEAFAEAYPQSPYNEMLDARITYARDRDEHRRMVTEQLDAIVLKPADGSVRWMDKMPASKVRTRLMELARKLPGESKYEQNFRARIQRQLGLLDDRRRVIDEERIEQLRHRVRLALGASRPAQAERLIAAYRKANPGILQATAEQLAQLDEQTAKALQAAFDEAWKTADATTSPAAAREALAKAWPALAGTELGARLENRLRDTMREQVDHDPRPDDPSTPGPDAGPDSPAPEMPGVTEAMLEQATRAQALIAARSWTAGLKLLDEVLAKTERGRMRNEWDRLRSDVVRVQGLTSDLATRLAEKPLTRRLSVGKVQVTAATADDVTWTVGSTPAETHKWPDVPDEDVLLLLVPKKPTPAQRLAGAVLASDLSDRETLNELLVPLFEKQTLVAEASALLAWRIHGRSTPPEGGYQVYDGEILDAKEVAARREQEQIASLFARAGTLLTQLEKQKAFRKVTKMRALRDELDRRRTYALLAIFNEKHYPYPANKQGKPYRAVQKEIDIRIDAVRAIWDDPYKFRIGRTGQIGKILTEHTEVVTALEKLGQDTRDVRASVAPFAMYATDETITVREFFKDAREKERLTYNRWVMNEYNPARTEYAKGTESKQTRVTNDYRVMMGYQAQVRPGGAAFDSIDDSSVVSVLDAGKVLRLVPLRAVRIDNRLVKAARLHSLDMQKRGYFSHYSKPNPAAGIPQTSPHERMRTAGYQGFGSSENIANGAGSPEAAHWMWRHSSGHHRNLISNWIDMGCGHAGRLWTQNFGMGGGARARQQDTTDVLPPARGGPPMRSPTEGG